MVLQQRATDAARASILIVEDESHVADAVKLILEEGGYRVRLAASAREALAQLQAKQFDLVITDVGLPDMTGLEVLAAIKGREPQSRVVVMTAYATPEMGTEARARGAADVLIKPFTPSDLLKSVSTALAYREDDSDRRGRVA